MHAYCFPIQVATGETSAMQKLALEQTTNGVDWTDSFPLERLLCDKVLFLSCAYGMTQSVLRFLEQSAGIELVMVDLVPTGFASSDAVIEAVEAKVAEHGGPSAFAMGVISHLSSVPACVLPVARFCAALSGVPV